MTRFYADDIREAHEELSVLEAYKAALLSARITLKASEELVLKHCTGSHHIEYASGYIDDCLGSVNAELGEVKDKLARVAA